MGAMQAARMAEEKVSPYWATIAGVLVLAVLLWAVLNNWVAQLSDVLNPNSAAEAPRWHIEIGQVYVTGNWLLNVLCALLIWCGLLWVVFQVNRKQATKQAHEPEALPWLMRWPGGERSMDTCYLRLVVWTWLIATAMPALAIVSLWVSEHLHRGQPERVDYHGMAMVGTCALLGLLSISVANWVLGIQLRVGFLVLLPWLPFVVLVVALFSKWPFTEGGKGIWNAYDLSGPERGATPTATLNFLSNTSRQDFKGLPPSPSKSQALDEPPAEPQVTAQPTAQSIAPRPSQPTPPSKLRGTGKVQGTGKAENSQTAQSPVAPAPSGAILPIRTPETSDAGDVEYQPRKPTSAREANHEGPVVIICASGGGSRAALFTAGILSRMWWQRASGENYRVESGAFSKLSPQEQGLLREAVTARGFTPKANNSNAPLYPGRLLLQRADAISSVSGGSLACAYLQNSLLQSLRADQASPPRGTAPHTISLLARDRALRKFFGTASKSPSVSPHLPVIWYGQPRNALSLQALFHDVTQGLKAKKSMEALWEPVPGEDDAAPGKITFQERVERNPFIHAMRQDHLGATIAGFFLPWRGRGPSLESFWEERMGWIDRDTTGARQPRRLTDFYPYEKDGRLPVLILNGTLARTGTRIAITNLGEGEFQSTYKYGPQPIRADLGEGPDILACQPNEYLNPVPSASPPTNPNVTSNTASNVTVTPGGTSTVGPATHTVTATPPAASEERSKRRFDPLPGQIHTLNELDAHWRIPLRTATRASANFPFGFPLLTFERRCLANDGAIPYANEKQDILEISDGGMLDNTAVDTVMALLRANRKEIATRGVLIFQIDSGELPRNPGLTSFDPLLHHYSEASNGLWRTNLNLQAALHSLYLEELCEIAGERSADLKPIETPIQSTDSTIINHVFGYAGTKFAFFRVRAGEMAADHVMTSWHLNAMQRVKVYEQVSDPLQGEAILQAAQWLAKARRTTKRHQ